MTETPESWCYYDEGVTPSGEVCRDRDVGPPHHVDCECCGCPACAPEDWKGRRAPQYYTEVARSKTRRERLFGPGAYYEGGGTVPLRVLAATWLAFRLERGAHCLRMWGHSQEPKRKKTK